MSLIQNWTTALVECVTTMCLLLTESTKNLVKQKPLINYYFTQEPEVETYMYFQLVKLKKICILIEIDSCLENKPFSLGILR